MPKHTRTVNEAAFAVVSARRQTVNILLDQCLFTLDNGRYDAFVQALDDAPEPGLRLRALLSRTLAWDR